MTARGSRFPAPEPVSPSIRVLPQSTEARIATAAAHFDTALAVLQGALTELARAAALMLAELERQTEHTTMEPLMTTSDVAAFLGKSKDGVRLLSKKGLLRDVDTGEQSPRYRPEDVRAYVEKARR